MRLNRTAALYSQNGQKTVRATETNLAEDLRGLTGLDLINGSLRRFEETELLERPSLEIGMFKAHFHWPTNQDLVINS